MVSEGEAVGVWSVKAIKEQQEVHSQVKEAAKGLEEVHIQEMEAIMGQEEVHSQG